MSFELKSEDQGTNEMSVFHQKIAHLGRFKNSGCQTDEPSKWCSKHKLQVQNETNLPKRPPQGCGWVCGVNWSDGRDSVNDGKGRQSTHNHRTITAQPNTNKLSTNNYHCTNTNKLPTHNYHCTTKYKHNHTNKYKQNSLFFVLWYPSLLNDETNWKENTVWICDWRPLKAFSTDNLV